MRLDSQQAASTIDPALLARVAKGEPQAFGQLYDISSALLYSMALRILGSREEAAELLQEVYLAVWRKVVRYDIGRGAPIAWLITLTRNHAIDRLRARGARGLRHADQPLDSRNAGRVVDRSPAPFEAQADQELRRLIDTALAGLPQAQRQAIELAYYDGLSYAEIAAKLNQSPGAVKTRIKLGMIKLREALRHDGERGHHS